MLLYKYRSLQNFDFVLDILLHERLYCSPYNELNDPFEGLFYSVYQVPLWDLVHPAHAPFGYETPPGGTRKVRTRTSLADATAFMDKHRVCSLSANPQDIRLWSHYADGHKGVAIAIEFEEHDENLYRVTYEYALHEHSGGGLLSVTTSSDVLSYKTKHWEYEGEYRIIISEEYYSVPGKIKALYAGPRISDQHRDLLQKVLPEDILLVPTQLNEEEVTIDPQ